METPAPWTSGRMMPPIPMRMERDRDEQERRDREYREELERRRREEAAEERRRQIEEDRRRSQDNWSPTDQNEPKGPRRR